MILQVQPGSPAVVSDGAALILAPHIGGGVIGVLAGAAALAAPKGRRTRRVSAAPGAWLQVAATVRGEVL
jgi:hypothetical protein